MANKWCDFHSFYLNKKTDYVDLVKSSNGWIVTKSACEYLAHIGNKSVNKQYVSWQGGGG